MNIAIKSGLTVSILVGTAGLASAADLVVYEPTPVEPIAAAEPFDWAGFYVGVHGGYAWGHETDNQSEVLPPPTGTPTGTPPPTGDEFDMQGFVGGVHAGHNWQDNQLVFGIEGDLDFASVSGSADYSNGGTIAGEIGLESNWQASLRVRAGYAVDSLLLYGTGGVAFAGAELTSSGVDTGIPFSSSDSNTHVGWTVGAGLEYAFDDNWIGRTEVRYTDFGSQTYDLSEGAVDSSWTQTAVTAGLSYKF